MLVWVYSSVHFQQETATGNRRCVDRLNRRCLKLASVDSNRRYIFKSSEEVYSPVKPVMSEVNVGAYPTAILGDSVYRDRSNRRSRKRGHRINRWSLRILTSLFSNGYIWLAAYISAPNGSHLKSSPIQVLNTHPIELRATRASFIIFVIKS
jgi:hypothetical protein